MADDFSGATDHANDLVFRGHARGAANRSSKRRCAGPDDADAVVVTLKSRTAPMGETVITSIAAARWLRSCGNRQQYFKVCSTFDSTP